MLEHLRELAELARSCDSDPVGQKVLRRATLDSRSFYGKGQLQNVADEARELQATLLICDDELTGGQVRNIEKTTGMACMDRTGLILAIFEQRAQSREAKAQVELHLNKPELSLVERCGTLLLEGLQNHSQLPPERS